MSLVSTKVIALLLLASLSLVSGLVPLKMKSYFTKESTSGRGAKRRGKIVSCLLCFGAGVLLATVFIHMLPETREGFQLARKTREESEKTEGEKAPSSDNLISSIKYSRNNLTKKTATVGDDDRRSHVHYNDESKDLPNGYLSHDYFDKARSGLNDRDGNDDYPVDLTLKNGGVTRGGTAPVPVYHGHPHDHFHDHDHPNDHDHHHDHDDHHDHNHDYDMAVDGSFDHLLVNHNTGLPIGTSLSDHTHSHGHDHDHEFRAKSNGGDHSHNHDHDHFHGSGHDHDHHNGALRKAPVSSVNLGTRAESNTQNSDLFDGNPKILIDVAGKVVTLGHHHDDDHDHDQSRLKKSPQFEALTQDDHAGHDHDHHADHKIEIKGNVGSEKGGHEGHVGHEDHEGHDHGEHEEESHNYPLAELVICCGFFLIYFIEEAVHKVVHGTSGHKKKELISASLRRKPTQANGGHSQINVTPFHTHSNGIHGNGVANGHLGGNSDVAFTRTSGSPISIPAKSDWSSRGGLDNPSFDSDAAEESRNGAVSNGHLPNGNNAGRLNGSNGSIPDLERRGANGSLDNFHSHIPPMSASSDHKMKATRLIVENLRSLLVVLALSFHSVFEGLAVGLQERDSDVWYLFAAIAAHKFVIVFCVGLELIIVGTPTVLFVIYIVVLSLVSPLGVAIGIAITENADLGGAQHLTVVTVLQGIAGGTILYVTFLEVLERERRKSGNQLLKLFSLAVGFTCMAVLEAMGGHSHGPSHGEDVHH